MSEEFKFKKIHFIFLFIFLFSIFFIQVFEFVDKDADFNFSGNRLNLIVVESDYQKHKGLGNRDDLGGHDGMIFLFPEAYKLGVVMRDMRFPIDIVWFNNGEVVDMVSNVQLEPGVKDEDLRVYFPRLKSDSFLELRAGWIEEKGVKIGDKIEYLN